MNNLYSLTLNDLDYAKSRIKIYKEMPSPSMLSDFLDEVEDLASDTYTGEEKDKAVDEAVDHTRSKIGEQLASIVDTYNKKEALLKALSRYIDNLTY